MIKASTRALAAKDFYNLLPLTIALVALELLGLIDGLVSQSPDENYWADVAIFLDPELALGVGVAYIIIGIIAAFMIFPHERTQNTLLFLWSLPVSRWRVYVVKIATAFAVLASLILLGHLLLIATHEFSIGSITRAQFTWPLWTLEVLSLISVTAIGLGYGALIAYYRVVGVLVFVLVWIAAAVLTAVNPSFEFLNAGALLVPEYRGSEVLLNSKAWTVHSVAALACAIAGGFLFIRDGQPPADRSRMKRIGSRIASGLMVLLALTLTVGYAFTVLAPRLTGTDRSTAGTSEQLNTAETRYYEFSYLSNDSEQAQILLGEADSLSEQVQEMLNYTSDELILADLTDNSPDHLGIAGWKKLRMERSALYDDEQRAHVFVHESAHVLAAAASDRRLSDNRNFTVFFNEGQAEWVSYEILGLDEQRNALRLLAALAWNRLDLRFRDFLYASSFRARYDENLIYALGEAWVSTLAEVCGKEAPGAALQAMGRPGIRRQMEGGVFWRDTLQAAGCDLTAVNGRFALMMRDYQSEIAHVPSLSGTITAEDDKLLATLSLTGGDAEEVYSVVVRVRDNPDASPASVFSKYAEMQTGESITLTLPRAMISGQRFQYQLGIEFLPDQRPYFGRWIDEG